MADQFRRAVLRRERNAALRLIAVYDHIWQRIFRQLTLINQQIAEAKAKGEIVNQAWLFRQKRYGDLLRQVDDEFKRFADITGVTVTRLQASAAKAGLRDSTALATTAIEQADLAVTFNKLPVAAVENMAGFLSNGSPLSSLLDQFPRAGRKIVEEALLEGVALGINPNVTARKIRDALLINRHRALSISRTETLRAYRTATIQNYRANEDIITGWYWRSARSRRTCAACIALDGTFHPTREPMKPHVRCIPAGALIHAPTVEASTARWYEGELIEFTTLGGHWLSVTPNHPVLTAKGWIAAGLLNEGDEIVSARFPERVIAAVDPDKNHIPARIEEIASASLEDGGVASSRMPTAPEDFHGDGIGSQVHVVHMHGLLSDSFNAALGEPLRHQDLVSGNIALNSLLGDGALDLFLDGMLADAGDGVGDFGISPVLFRCALGHHEAVGVKAGSPFDAVLVQDAADYIAGDVETVSDGFFGLSRQVARANIGLRKNASALFGDHSHARQPDDFVLRRTSPQSALFESIPERGQIGMEACGDFLRAFPGNVFLDRVLKISRSNFSGQVYNLQTSTGWYISNGIITHNCRCTLIPGVKGVNPDKGPTWFNRQDAETQREIIGTDSGYKAIRNGDLTIKDFVGLQRNPLWGESYYQLSVRRALAGEGQFPE